MIWKNAGAVYQLIHLSSPLLSHQHDIQLQILFLQVHQKSSLHSHFSQDCVICQAVMAQAFNPSTWEAEAGGSLWVRGQPSLRSEFQYWLCSYWETLSQKTKKKVMIVSFGLREYVSTKSLLARAVASRKEFPLSKRVFSLSGQITSTFNTLGFVSLSVATIFAFFLDTKCNGEIKWV